MSRRARCHVFKVKQLLFAHVLNHLFHYSLEEGKGRHCLKIQLCDQDSQCKSPSVSAPFVLSPKDMSCDM